jgi:beta-ureidopropionase
VARQVRVATVAQARWSTGTTEDARERVRGLLERVVTLRPDIVCLPEAFASVGTRTDDVRDVAEPVPGPSTDMAARVARQQGCYVICPVFHDRGDCVTNDAVLIDRGGAIVGAYSKRHPVVSDGAFASLERGVTPGSELSVFDTDFGLIAMQICFDINWDADWAELKRRGAEIVFWPSDYNGGKHLAALAWTNHFYVVSAVNSYYARIIGIMGEELATTGLHDPVVCRTINLDIGLFHLDFNLMQIEKIQERYGPEVTVHVWSEEGVFTLESEREDLTVAQVADEFALEPLSAYLARNERLQDAIRAGEAPPNLRPAYASRPKWA